MIELYYFPSPNGLKIAIMLEECGLPYEVVPVDIGSGEQFRPEYLLLNPNNKIPTIVDRETGIGVFESGAILIYLAEKSQQLLPTAADQRIEVLSWLFWQVGGLGPMAGQAHHFRAFATEDVPYGIDKLVQITSFQVAQVDADTLFLQLLVHPFGGLAWN